MATWAAPSLKPGHPGPTGTWSAGASARLGCACTPRAAARQGRAVRLGPWGSLSTQSHPGPEDLSGWAGGVAMGTHIASTLLEAFTGNRSQDDPRPGTCPRKPFFPARKNPGSPAASLCSPATWLTPSPEMPAAWDRFLWPLRSPPLPGAAGHILGCQGSVGSRCKGGQGAGTARRALGAGREGCRQPLAQWAPQKPRLGAMLG